MIINGTHFTKNVLKFSLKCTTGNTLLPQVVGIFPERPRGKNVGRTHGDRTEGMVEIDQPLQGCLSGHTERWGTMDQNKPLEDGAAARALAEASSREDDWATDGMDSVKPWSTARTPSRALQVRTELAPAALTGARGCCLILARSDCFC